MQTSHKIHVIGVGGCARAGKDTFVSILINELAKKGFKSKKISLADPLKGCCNSFCKEHLGISAYTQIPEQKLLIRPLLVWFGDAKRKQTNGRFWVELATTAIDQADHDGYDYAIISDVRYSFYEHDELQWLKQEHNAPLVHVSRLVKSGEFIQPANEHEYLNDPKIKIAADYIVEWPTIDSRSASDLENHPTMVQYVTEFLDSMEITRNRLPNRQNLLGSIPIEN